MVRKAFQEVHPVEEPWERFQKHHHKALSRRLKKGENTEHSCKWHCVRIESRSGHQNTGNHFSVAAQSSEFPFLPCIISLTAGLVVFKECWLNMLSEILPAEQSGIGTYCFTEFVNIILDFATLWVAIRTLSTWDWIYKKYHSEKSFMRVRHLSGHSDLRHRQF